MNQFTIKQMAAAVGVAWAPSVLLAIAVFFPYQPGPSPEPQPPTPAPGAPISLPPVVKAQPGRLVKIQAATRATVVRWHCCSANCDLLGVDRFAVFVCPVAGKYEVIAWVSIDGIPSEAARCVVMVEGPGPIPPDPGPDPPIPPTPPVPVELRVLVVHETGDLNKMPAAQRAILTSVPVRDFLTAKCAKDGTQPAFRFYDDNAAPTVPWLKDAMAKPRKSLPWIVIVGVYEGPLPANVEEMLALLKRYAK